MPNLASVKEELQVSPFLKDGVFHSDSQQPISIQGAPNRKRGERIAFATFWDLVREPCWREGGVELGREILFTRAYWIASV